MVTPREEMIEIKIKPLSVNIAWRGRRFKTLRYKEYEKELMYKLPKSLKIPEGKLKLYVEFGMSRASDWDNPIKPFVDVLQKKYHFNDNRIFEARVIKKISKEPYINFEIITLP